MGTLVQKLFDGPLDVIGDVHGEIEALNSLLSRLGYDSDGIHPAGRRLVFAGDLSDRGPDSPGVFRLVMLLVESGRAQAIAGNHELNLLLDKRKHGNHWFYGLSFDPEHPDFGHCAAIGEAERAPILAFIRALPVALERKDLRIVHAAWIDSDIERCRSTELPLDEAYQVFEDELLRDARYVALKEQHDRELARLGEGGLKDKSPKPSATAIGPFEECRQQGNPIRVITSGVERAISAPFSAGGKWRFADRVAWWREYTGEAPVLFGHYWRWWDPAIHAILSKGETQLFADDPVGPYMAEHHQAFCVDFSVGSRYKQRHRNQTEDFHGRLAAMRWPEHEIVYDAEDSGL
jgi:hypothetical protein